VIVARYKPKDPLFKVADSFFNLEAEFYISSLGLVELFSVLSRVVVKAPIGRPSLSTLVSFVLRDCNLHLIKKSYFTTTTIAGLEFTIPLEYYAAMRLARTLRLRALDLLHVAIASLARKDGLLQVFVTGDKEILRRRKRIQASTGLLVKHPSELI
jgi:hypothetical protein